MRYLTIILCVVLSACVTQRGKYDHHAPEIMEYVAQETGKPAAPIPAPVFTPQVTDHAAFYDPENNVILLQEDWGPSIEGLGSLAHEFTHAIQHHNAPEIRQKHREWDRAIKAGNTEHIPEWMKQGLQDCLKMEREAYEVAYNYQLSINPDYWKHILGPITIEEASDIHANGSCEPWRLAQKLHSR